MNQLTHCLVWLSRMHRCRGFGIQSPKDYAFVRYVINEHWPYYAYSQFADADWLTSKLGALYFRLANWRQPRVMKKDRYEAYFHAGCRKTVFASAVDKVELARVDITAREELDELVERTDMESVLVVEGIFRDRDSWLKILQDKRVGTTFDLYYCGVLFFDTNRYKHHYKINF